MTGLPKLKGYRITDLIGQGGMATVYKAVQEGLERPVALKFLASHLASDADFAKRFLREARIVGQLSHAHIVPVYDVGEQDGHYYLSMEWLSGGDLKAVMGGGVSDARKRTILIQVAQALRYAHARGFVHRDIKPDNILFRDAETAVVTDFGIAREISEEPEMTEITVVKSVIGSPKYMSPEQARGETLDARSDLYSLGVVAWQLLTGQVPHAGNTITEIAINRHEEPVPSLPTHLSHWQPICNRLLAYQAEERYADCGELLRDLEALALTPTQQPLRPDQADLTSIYDPDATMVEPERTAIDNGTAAEKSIGNIKTKGTWVWAVIGLTALAVAITAIWWPRSPAVDEQPVAQDTVPPIAATTQAKTSVDTAPEKAIEPAVSSTLREPGTGPGADDARGRENDSSPRNEVADEPAVGTEIAAATDAATPSSTPAVGQEVSAQALQDDAPESAAETGETQGDSPVSVRSPGGTGTTEDQVDDTIVSPKPDEYFAFRDAIQPRNPAAAREFLRRYPESILGEILRVGVLGETENVAQIRTRADSGDTAAQLILSELYATGWGTAKDPSRALRYAASAAETGQPFPRYHLAALKLAQSPQDTAVDEPVVHLLRESADAGFFLAHTLLGSLLFTNRVGDQSDPTAGLAHFEQAAAQGDRNALFNLGVIYDSGLNDVKQDSGRALGYFQEAAALGHRNAQDYLP